MPFPSRWSCHNPREIHGPWILIVEETSAIQQMKKIDPKLYFWIHLLFLNFQKFPTESCQGMHFQINHRSLFSTCFFTLFTLFYESFSIIKITSSAFSLQFWVKVRWSFPLQWPKPIKHQPLEAERVHFRSYFVWHVSVRIFLILILQKDNFWPECSHPRVFVQLLGCSSNPMCLFCRIKVIILFQANKKLSVCIPDSYLANSQILQIYLCLRYHLQFFEINWNFDILIRPEIILFESIKYQLGKSEVWRKKS